jgi:CDP-6-deoxy-D-xylo-4-hexulose-3-dehydrase
MGKRDKIIEYLARNKVETRPIVAGNFTLNPVMKHLKFNPILNLPNSNLIHNEGFFIGNHHLDVTRELKEVHSLLVEFENENN